MDIKWYVLSITFSVIDFLVFLYFCITLLVRVCGERKLIKKAESIYKRNHIWNFIIEMSVVYIPAVFIYCIVCFSLNNEVNANLISWMIRGGTITLTILVLMYIIIINVVGDSLIIIKFNGALIFLSKIVIIDKIAAVDFNESRNHLYINYVNDEGIKDMIKLRNKPTLLKWLKSLLKEEIFII